MAQRMRGSQGGHRRKTAGSQTCWAGSRRRGLFQDRRSGLRVHAPRWRGRSHGAGRATPQSTHAHGAVAGGWRHAEPPATDLILQMKDRREPMHMRMDDCCPSFFTVPVFRSRMRPRGEDTGISLCPGGAMGTGSPLPRVCPADGPGTRVFVSSRPCNTKHLILVRTAHEDTGVSDVSPPPWPTRSPCSSRLP